MLTLSQCCVVLSVRLTAAHKDMEETWWADFLLLPQCCFCLFFCLPLTQRITLAPLFYLSFILFTLSVCVSVFLSYYAFLSLFLSFLPSFPLSFWPSYIVLFMEHNEYVVLLSPSSSLSHSPSLFFFLFLFYISFISHLSVSPPPPPPPLFLSSPFFSPPILAATPLSLLASLNSVILKRYYKSSLRVSQGAPAIIWLHYSMSTQTRTHFHTHFHTVLSLSVFTCE